MRPSERAQANTPMPEDVFDAMLILHGPNAMVYPVPFHLVERGDRLILGPLVNAIRGVGPCGDVAATSGEKGRITTQGGLCVTRVGSDEDAHIWVVELEDR